MEIGGWEMVNFHLYLGDVPKVICFVSAFLEWKKKKKKKTVYMCFYILLFPNKLFYV